MNAKLDHATRFTHHASEVTASCAGQKLVPHQMQPDASGSLELGQAVNAQARRGAGYLVDHLTNSLRFIFPSSDKRLIKGAWTKPTRL